MKPRRATPHLINNARQLLNTHLRQLIIIHNSPTPGLLTLDNITRRGFSKLLTVDTSIQPNPRLKRCLDLLRGHRCLCREDGDKIQRRGRISRQLPEDLERVAAIASPSARNTGCSEFIIFSWIVGGSISVLGRDCTAVQMDMY